MGLLEALKQFASDAAGGSLNPEVGNTLSGLLNYGKDRAKYIGGLLDDSSPINKDFKNWHDRTQLGLADLIAGKEGPQADYGYSQIMNMAGNAPMGITKVVGPRHQAMETARRNAVEMLGLPENNTAMDRAKAMGIDTPAVHFSRHGADVTELDSGKYAIAPFDAVGTHVGTEGAALDRFKNTVGYKVGNPQYANDEISGVSYPVFIRTGREMLDANGKPFGELPISMQFSEKADYANLRRYNEELRGDVFSKYDSIPYVNDVESAGQISHIVPPKNIRSRFAAFDPARRHEADLLGRATPEMLGLTTLGSLLGLEAMRRNQE